MVSTSLVAWRQRRSPHHTLWIVGVGVAVALLGDLTLYVVLPTHTEQAGIALANVGLMLSANRLIRIVMNGPMGIIIERLPRRRIAVPALFVGAFSSLLYTVPGFWPLLAGRLLWGIAWSGIWLSASTMALDISMDDNRGRFVGKLQMWFFTGAGVSALLGGALTDWLGYRSTFIVCALLTLGGALTWWLLLPETRPDPAAQSGSASHTAPRTQPTPPALPQKNQLPLLTAIGLLGINWLIFMGTLGATLPLLLEERIGETVLLAGLLIPLATFTGALSAANQLVGLLSAPLAGWLSDVSQRRWALVLAALGLGVVATGLIAIGEGIVIVIATMISAVATSVLQTQVMTLVGDYTGPRQRGRVLGILNTVGDLGSAGGPLIAYALLTSISLASIFGLSTGLLVLVFPWTLWVARNETRNLQPRAAVADKTAKSEKLAS